MAGAERGTMTNPEIAAIRERHQPDSTGACVTCQMPDAYPCDAIIASRHIEALEARVYRVSDGEVALLECERCMETDTKFGEEVQRGLEKHRRINTLEARVEALEGPAREVDSLWDDTLKAVNSVTMSAHIHGVKYKGPNFGAAMTKLRAALATSEEGKDG